MESGWWDGVPRGEARTLRALPACEHPPPLLEDPHERPVRADAVHVHLRPADHQVDVDRRDVDPGGEAAVVVERRRIARDRVRVAGADGDVRGRVLVEEAVPEEDAAPPDRGVDVDEGDLAERDAPGRSRASSAGSPRPARARSTTRLLRTQPSSLHRRAVPVERRRERTVPSVVSRSGVVKTSSVGRLTTAPAPRTSDSSQTASSHLDQADSGRVGASEAEGETRSRGAGSPWSAAMWGPAPRDRPRRAGDEISSHRRSTSALRKARAQPSVGHAITPRLRGG